MNDPKPPIDLELVWEGDLRFRGRTGDLELMLDSATVAGPSPVQALVFALGGCMGMDLVHILKKARQPLQGLRARMTARRADDHPKCIVSVSLHFIVQGDIQPHQVERAIELSRDKYCSVWRSMRPDIGFTIDYTLQPVAAMAG
jgi:putative redox protein